jgi:phosphatidylinositol alpha-1,6-mannosyltransferase
LSLSKKGYVVSVIADQRGPQINIELIFDAAQPFSIHRIRLHKLRLFMYVERIQKTFEALKRTDFVIATGKFSLWNVAFCTRLIKCPSLAVIHGTEVNFKSMGNKTLVEASLRRFDTIVAVSNYTKQLIRHLKLKVEVIPNGININQWNTHSRSDINLKGHPLLTTVGRVSHRKGQLNVIRMLPDLVSKFPELHYHCIGIPSEAEDFLSIARTLEVENYITFHGILDDVNLKLILSNTDIFVMLSNESQTGDVEGFGIAILEANAMGIPAIGSLGCGIEDAIDTSNTGFLIDTNDARSFQESIIQILNDRSRFKNNSKEWAQQHDWDRLIERYLVLLP